ncbi:MAG: DUF1905 domain-containing protein [Antricoccus sp.]
MTATPSQPGQGIAATFTTTIISDSNSGWTCVQMSDSATFFGSGKAVKVGVTVDGHDYQATMLPVGGGTQMMPLRAAFGKKLKKGVGDDVTVHLTHRFFLRKSIEVSNATESGAPDEQRMQQHRCPSGHPETPRRTAVLRIPRSGTTDRHHRSARHGQDNAAKTISTATTRSPPRRGRVDPL